MNTQQQIDDGGPAYPVSTRQAHDGDGYGHQDSNSTWQFGGLTIRDHFATHAPEPSPEKIASEKQWDKMRNPFNEPHKPRLRDDEEIIATLRYKRADAMIAARKAVKR